jgi:hypothetical protein
VILGQEVHYLHLQFDNQAAGLPTTKVVEYFNRVTRVELDMKGRPDRWNRPLHSKNFSFPAVKIPDGISYQHDQRSPKMLVEHTLSLSLGKAEYQVEIVGDLLSVQKQQVICRILLPESLHPTKQQGCIDQDRKRIILPGEMALADLYSVTQFRQMLNLG